LKKILTTKGCENNKPLTEKQQEGSTKIMKIATLSNATGFVFLIVAIAYISGHKF